MLSIMGSQRLKSLEQDRAELSSTRMKLDETKKELDILKQRVRDVENAYTEKTGLQIRNDVTTVFTKFTKVEMIIMMSGCYALMKTSQNAPDITMYTVLINKLQGFIDKMEDDDAAG